MVLRLMLTSSVREADFVRSLSLIKNRSVSVNSYQTSTLHLRDRRREQTALIVVAESGKA
jgi:hypothetical protein